MQSQAGAMERTIVICLAAAVWASAGCELEEQDHPDPLTPSEWEIPALTASPRATEPGVLPQFAGEWECDRFVEFDVCEWLDGSELVVGTIHAVDSLISPVLDVYRPSEPLLDACPAGRNMQPGLRVTLSSGVEFTVGGGVTINWDPAPLYWNDETSWPNSDGQPSGLRRGQTIAVAARWTDAGVASAGPRQLIAGTDDELYVQEFPCFEEISSPLSVHELQAVAAECPRTEVALAEEHEAAGWCWTEPPDVPEDWCSVDSDCESFRCDDRENRCEP